MSVPELRPAEALLPFLGPEVNQGFLRLFRWFLSGIHIPALFLIVFFFFERI